ncbi:MAG TPA: MarR family transcriptional regulator [Mycobacteriales bacterium]|jgi:DNA-binding MarR family transcriptional regulator|nr:MarR family transcriptional regulator [Mycobacteriales bacterium]
MQRIPGASPDPATDLLITASRALVAIAAKSLARVEDQVTLPQYRALVVLASRDRLRPIDLADALDVSPSTATRMCDRLVRKELVERVHSDSDRREVVLRLSPDGRALVGEVTSARRRDLRRVVGRIAAEDQKRLIEALRVFNDAAGEAPESTLALGMSL